MKYFFLFSILFLFSCSKHNTTEYYESGELKTECEYESKRNKTGLCKEYYKSGELKSTIPYTNGKIHGIAKHYFLENKLRQIAPHFNGKIHGEVKAFHRNGMHRQILFFEKGEHLRTKYFHYDSILDMERIFIIDPEKDTLKFGENYKAKIKVKAAIEDTVYIVNKLSLNKSSRSRNYIYIDTVSNYLTREKWFEYSPPHKENSYSLYISIGIDNPNSKGFEAYEFVQDFFVRDDSADPTKTQE